MNVLTKSNSPTLQNEKHYLEENMGGIPNVRLCVCVSVLHYLTIITREG